MYTLGVTGGGPPGSPFSDLVADPLGLHGTLALDAVTELIERCRT